jgi:predicted RNA-binding Zn ribbon-like protein
MHLRSNRRLAYDGKALSVKPTRRARARAWNPAEVEEEGVGSIEEPGAKEPAPGDLRIVQLFVNSLDIEEGTEQWATPAALSAWLHRHGLADARLRLGQRDLERARAFRELLRAMALANNGRPMSPAKVTDLKRELARLRFVAATDASHGIRFESATGGLDQALGRIVAIVNEEMILGRWNRMKACARDVCHWVFFDHSRNRTGTWCSMSICGSRTKVSAYYRRHRRGNRLTRSRPETK